ncbi:Phosphoserine phosphatase [Ignavibacterium album JCM 16511]|uniref:Phosphoserine phosphatase n=1 Tax=Ignavibacterium album (strain DSM 19864 / JCM 16511 / NBRC 101810 / Mat9-16) TaxID=945713 RepID=I0AMH6_IGNAJ|nr:HAD family hydrolase [Ignavibacterium album]AFH50183.1 Phosphoserine phosphatase [Ignavibacterium album JCM 16511]
MKLFAFDFDKTITITDTILPLCKFLSKRFNSSLSFYLIQLLFAVYRIKLISSKKFKESVIKYLLKNKNSVEIENAILDFYKLNYEKLFNSVIINLIEEEKKAGNRIIIVTSNLDLFVYPIKKLLPVDEVFGTKVKIVNELVYDSIEGENCSGNEKSRVIQEYKSNQQFDKVISYGDSSGDFEMLKSSDESFIAEYRFNSVISKIMCRLRYICGKTCNDGFQVTFKKFNSS